MIHTVGELRNALEPFKDTCRLNIFVDNPNFLKPGERCEFKVCVMVPFDTMGSSVSILDAVIPGHFSPGVEVNNEEI